MDALSATEATATAINKIPAGFMFDPDTYATGASLGLPGIAIYVYGRGGALGDVDADVVTAAFAFFDADVVRGNWDVARPVMAPRDAAAAFERIGGDWLAARVPADLDVRRLADLAARVAAAASPACAPLFAAWRAMPEPEDPPGAALHHLNVLRELRGGVHAACVLGAGLTPLEAVLVNSPHMAGIFGWSEPFPDVSGCAAAWTAAEEATNRAIAPAFEVLRTDERIELVALLDRLLAALS